ncbi:MAG: RecQ family ATP-dependent DNA helicase [Gammaproteobacteria bacterium]|nr:RecQ family ATP-dependent DNA helicase [Gammaproteobacteria bacterium]
MDAVDFYEAIDTIAQDRFQIKTLKPFQGQVINDFLNQHDVLLISSTGSGKSLCYQLPALLMPGTIIVVSPLIALMHDQVKKLQHQGIDAAFLHAHQTTAEQQTILQKLCASRIKLLYISPEKLLQARFLQFLKNQKISGFIIDEVHCMLQWGHDFRPEYQGLSSLKRRFPNLPIMALTATASPKQQQQIILDLGLNARITHAKTERFNLEYQMIPSLSSKDSLNQILAKHGNQNGIIYAATRQRVTSTYHYLQSIHSNVLHYHGGLEANFRQSQQQQFEQNESGIMVATLAFGMGIDKQDIRYIIHMDIPARLDQFVQESGRAGRDGEQAYSYLLYNPIHFLEFNLWKIKEAPPLLQQELIEELRLMAAFIHAKSCYQGILFAYFHAETGYTCGECAACLQQPYAPSYSLESQLKLLSCLYRLGAAAKPSILSDILRGVRNKETQGFQNLSTFGIGCDESKAYWYELMLILFIDGMIGLKVSDKLIWQLMPKGGELLKRRQTS